jgi:hypothetical protein
VRSVEVETYSEQVNAWVVRTPGRSYPALVVQGDTFSTFYRSAEALLDQARQRRDEELIELAMQLRDDLAGFLHHYETVLAENGFDLPYTRIPRST